MRPSHVSRLIRLKPRQPIQDTLIPLPRGPMFTRFRKKLFTGLKCLPFHLKIEFDVTMSCFNGRMPKPGSDHVEIDAGLKQMHGRGVSKSMRSNLPSEKGWSGFGRDGNSLGNEVP